MRVEAQIKRELMELEFTYNKELGEQKLGIEADRESQIEERKDKRARIVGTQQSAIANQKQNKSDAIDFEDPSSIENLQDPMNNILPQGL